MDFQLWLRVSCKSLLCFVFFLFCGISALLQAEKHSLYYIYTALSKPVDLPGIYEFTAMGLLDNTQIDYYNSEEKRMISTQQWMREKLPEDYWEKGTQSRKSKEQWFHLSLKNLMNRMRHDDSDLHVLQWRVGCEVEQQGDEVKFLKGVSEYGYDGENFLFFDINKFQWVSPVDAAQETKRKWDNVPLINQYTKGYLEKECVDWLNKFRVYRDEELRNTSPPDVHVFAKSKLKLTCMATGFYPKDVMVIIRKYRTSLSEDKMKSTGIRPNHDGSFQMRKSVEIKKEEKDEYDCFVSHSSLSEPIIKKWDGKYSDCLQKTDELMIGFVIGAVFMLIANSVVYIVVQKTINAGQAKKKSDSSATDSEEEKNEDDGMIEVDIPSDSVRTAPKTYKI